MRGKIRHISRRAYPQKACIIIGAPAALVGHRYLRNTYETNREIKYWSTWFLLKSLTTTSYIQHWISQKEYLFTWLQMNENTFRSHLAWLAREELLEVDKRNFSIRLCGYEAAAEKLGIEEYEGVYGVDWDPRKHPGKQTFQYLLRTEEFEHHKQRQITTLMYKIDNNPALKNDLFYQLSQMGADSRRLLSDRAYFADRMLRLQIKLFREGSDIFQYIMCQRADCNRGVKKIRKDHKYRGLQSVTYMKRKMAELGFASIIKVCIQSEARMRFYIPVEADLPPAEQAVQASGAKVRTMREGNRYVRNGKHARQTAWFLCDQVSRQYKADLPLNTLKSAKYAA